MQTVAGGEAADALTTDPGDDPLLFAAADAVVVLHSNGVKRDAITIRMMAVRVEVLLIRDIFSYGYFLLLHESACEKRNCMRWEKFNQHEMSEE